MATSSRSSRRPLVARLLGSVLALLVLALGLPAVIVSASTTVASAAGGPTTVAAGNVTTAVTWSPEGSPTPLSQVDRAGSALKDDPFHRSVLWVVDNPAAQRFSITGGDGVQRQLYQLPGELNGKPGVFEWIVGRSGSNPIIMHQRFISGGVVTGSPNQVP